MESGDIAELADPKMEGKYDTEELHRVILTASYCVRQTSTWRPATTEVNHKNNNIQIVMFGSFKVYVSQ